MADKRERLAAVDSLITDFKLYALEKRAILDWLEDRIAAVESRIREAATAEEAANFFNARRGLVSMQQNLMQQLHYYEEQSTALAGRMFELGGAE